jgi:hypothetical protein
VERGFRNPLVEESHVLLLTIVLGPKPVERYERTFALYPSGAKHILEDKNEEVDFSDRQDLTGIG